MNGRTALRPRRPPTPQLPHDVIIALLIIASRLEDALTNRSGQNIQTGFLPVLLNRLAAVSKRMPALCARAVYGLS